MRPGAADLERVVRAVERADVAGIGEHTHGDLLSWKWRLAICEELVRRGHALLILCENLDFFVADFRCKPVAFDIVGRMFVPHAIPFSDCSHEHLAFARRLAALPGAELHGIDVQALDHPGLVASCQPRPVAAALRRRARAWRRAGGEASRGAARNRLNAATILEMATMQRMQKKVLYFAHNEHVALSCAATRRDSAYRTEGAILRQALGARYSSVATFAPETWTTWTTRRPHLVSERRAPKGRGALLGAECSSPMGENYRVSDFDVAIIEDRSPRMTPLVSRNISASRHQRLPLKAAKDVTTAKRSSASSPDGSWPSAS